MRTVTAASILSGAFAKGGLAVPSDENALTAALEFLMQRLRYGAEYYRWPECIEVQHRYFRPEWVAGSYPAGTEIYAGNTYWRATEDVTSADVPGQYGAKGVLLAGVGIALAYSADGAYIIYTGAGGTASKWVEMIRFRKIVLWEQPGKDAVGAFLAAWTEDPLTSKCARRVPFLLVGDGAVFEPGYSNASVWVGINPPSPKVTPEPNDGAAAIAAGSFVYIEGDVYKVLTTTTAGDKPSTASAKFSLVPIPQFLAPALKAAVWSDICASDGAMDKATWWENKFTDLLDEQVTQLTKLQGQTTQLTWDDE